MGVLSNCGSLSKEARCGGLDENGFHRFAYSNALSEVVGTVWEGLVGAALLEEVCHGGRAWRFQQPMSFLVNTPPTSPAGGSDARSQLLLQHPACRLPPAAILIIMMLIDPSSETVCKPPIQCFLL